MIKIIKEKLFKAQKNEPINEINIDAMTNEELYVLLDSSYEKIILPPTLCLIAITEIANRYSNGDENKWGKIISQFKAEYPCILDIIEKVEEQHKESSITLN